MEQVRVERLDPLGVMASLLKDLGLMNMIDTRLVPDAQAMMTPGEAVVGMMLHGLGFAHRPFSFTPQFFGNKPLDRLCRHGINAEMCNRFTRGRTLDAAYAYGCDLWCAELALASCAREGMDRRFNHLDTTSFARTGEYVPDRDEYASHMTHGAAKDHRPDLTPAVLERMVSQAGGVPLVRKSWDGHTADTQVFQPRAEAWMRAFKDTPSPRDLVAEATLDWEDHAAQLAKLGLITRSPATRQLVSPVMTQALQSDTWQSLDDPTRYQALALCHDGMAQRGLGVSSPAADARAEATLHHATQRAPEAITKPLVHRQAQRFCAPEAAQEALAALAKRWQYHPVESSPLTEHRRDAGQGRPTARTPRKAIAWPIQAHVLADDKAMARDQQAKACDVLGPHIDASALRDTAGIVAYQGQAPVAGGVRFLHDPLLFVSSLFVKKPTRIEGVLLVMTLALVVYSVAHRRLRKP